MSEIDPEKPIDRDDLADALEYYRNGRGQNGRHLDLIFAAARAHLATLPRYKEVEVWHTEYAYRQSDGRWSPCVQPHESRANADENAANLRRMGTIGAIRVTGPHKQRVPA